MFARKWLAPVLAVGATLALSRPAGAAFITFDALANLPPTNSFRSLASANGGSSVLGGATWDANFFVVGGGYVEQFQNQGGSNPFATPQTPNFALFNANAADGLTIQTTDILTSLWLARPDMGNGARGTNQVTVQALNGVTVLGSRTITLTSTTPAFLDTSSFTALTGVTGYRLNRVAIGGDGYGGGHYIADSFQFRPVAVPVPATALIFAFGAGLAVARRRLRARCLPA